MASPAEAATAFVSFSRVEARQHRWYDTLASSAIAAGYGMVLTTPFKRKYNIDTSLNASPDGGFMRMSYKWVTTKALRNMVFAQPLIFAPPVFAGTNKLKFPSALRTCDGMRAQGRSSKL